MIGLEAIGHSRNFLENEG